jgi:hypothetical protein
MSAPDVASPAMPGNAAGIKHKGGDKTSASRSGRRRRAAQEA